MKKLIFVCALASFAFVGCKCNKAAAPAVEEETVATEEVAVAEEGVEGDTIVVAETEVAPAE